MEALTLRNLSFTYPGQTVPALNEISLSLPAGAFCVLCGPSGCGKSTLLRQCKSVLAPNGAQTGEILLGGVPLSSLSLREQAQRIGFVEQSPEDQLVTDRVWHELAFGLESLGCDTPTIRRRVSEMASFFGIERWFHKEVASLSGGQKQLLNLASVMVMQPEILILDEPTSQLDPIASADFLATLGRLNRELGITVLLTEHRLEEAFSLATEVAVMDSGRLLCTGSPAQVGMLLREQKHGMFQAMPTAMRVWAATESDAACPVTVREGREWLKQYIVRRPLRPLPEEQLPECAGEPVLSASELWFRYEKESPDVVRGLTLSLHRGEHLALLGGNGAGKSTALKLLSGICKPQRGEYRAKGAVGLLPQNPQALFVKKTLREDLAEALPPHTEDGEEQLRRVISRCRLAALLDRHPYDLSGGEQQRAALAKLLLRKPDLLLLDEPTKGLDAEYKEIFAGILQELLHEGVSVLTVSHDLEFCAKYAHRCALFFDGAIVTEATPRVFFSGNSFYTTSANRMAHGLGCDAVTAEDLMLACGGTLPSMPPPSEEQLPATPVSAAEEHREKRLPRWRKVLALLSGGGALGLLIHFLRITDLSQIIGAEGMMPMAEDQVRLSLLLVALIAIFAACVTQRDKKTAPASVSPPLPLRTRLATALSLALIPVTLWLGIRLGGRGSYYLPALFVLLESMLPFFLRLEGRKPQARELVTVSVLCALGVAGRAFFFMLPQFKPVMAIAILSGVALGGETGFLVGAVTMLASNVLFSQGPWTPWQMFSMGLTGLLAGVLFSGGRLRPSRIALTVYGVLAAFVLYGGIMNPASALIWAGRLDWKILLPYYLSGFPMDCVHAAATALFLWFGSEPILEKLERVKKKYGILR